ncbi:MAG: helix-turn-helix domain-containing protein [Synergistaceae bacterium]|nr:helix-turn-helix domain-containing protein [Synergistaceae bacterium]
MGLIRVRDLRVLREQRGLSQRKVSEKLKISETTLGRIEQGNYDNNTRHEIVRNYIGFLNLCPVKQKKEPVQ